MKECTLCTIPRRLTMLKRACPSLTPSWALFICVKPNSAEWASQTPGAISSFQWPVTAKYASWLLACHASHVRLTKPVLSDLITRSVGSNFLIESECLAHTLTRFRRFVRFCLKSSIIACRVALRFGIFTPFVARAAMPIILINVGCSSAWIGCQLTSVNRPSDGGIIVWHTWSVAISHSIAASRKSASVYGIVRSLGGGALLWRWGSIDDCLLLSAAAACSFTRFTAPGSFETIPCFFAHVSCLAYGEINVTM